MNTWPVAVRVLQGHTLIGIPERLGDGKPYERERYQAFPSLEAVAGEDWLATVLARLLPTDRPWGWWTRGEIFAKTRLAASRAPRVIDLERLDQIQVRRWRLRGGALVLIPPQCPRQQREVLEWAGLDTEPAPDFVFTAPTACDRWDLENIRRWCTDRSLWADPAREMCQPVERTIALFDGDVFCRLPHEAANGVLDALKGLAADWNLRLIFGSERYAWPAPTAG